MQNNGHGMDPIQQNQISQIAAMYGFQGPLPPNVVNLIIQLTENSRVINQLQAENTNIKVQNQQLALENLQLQIEHQRQLTKYHKKRAHYRKRLLSKDLDITKLKNELLSKKDIIEDYEEAIDDETDFLDTISKIFKPKDAKLQHAEKQQNAGKKRRLAVEDEKSSLIHNGTEQETDAEETELEEPEKDVDSLYPGIHYQKSVAPLLQNISRIKGFIKQDAKFYSLKDCLSDCFSYYGLFLKIPFFNVGNTTSTNEETQIAANTKYYACCFCRETLFTVRSVQSEEPCKLSLWSKPEHECDLTKMFENFERYFRYDKKLTDEAIDIELKKLKQISEGVANKRHHIWAFSLISSAGLDANVEFQIEQILNIVMQHKDCFITEDTPHDKQIKIFEEESLNVFLDINFLDDYMLYGSTDSLLGRGYSYGGTREKYRQEAQKTFQKILHQSNSQ